MASQKANMRRAWLSDRIGQTKSDAKLVAECSVYFGVTENTVKKDLAWVYERWTQIDAEMAPMHKAKFMELGFEILQEARDAANNAASQATFAPVVAQYKTLAAISGVLSEGLAQARGNQTPASAGDTRPSDQLVRERLSTLKSDPEVIAKAIKLGLDIDD